MFMVCVRMEEVITISLFSNPPRPTFLLEKKITLFLFICFVVIPLSLQWSCGYCTMQDGPKQIIVGNAVSQAQYKPQTHQPPHPVVAHSPTSMNNKQVAANFESPGSSSNTSSMFGHNGVEPSIKHLNLGSTSEIKEETGSRSSDVLQRAQAALASAERASAAARAAAELANINFTTGKV